MNQQIFILKFDFNRCYILRGKQTIMIDGGPPGKKASFVKQLKKFGIEPHEIKLIILTHGDFDHVGSAKDFKEVTGAHLAIHEKDRKNLEEGIFHWPPGVTKWGKMSRLFLKPFIEKTNQFAGVKPDIVFTDNDFQLNDFGIDGKVIYTPGHTPGSVSVVLSNGDVFAGCMAQNSFPFTLRPQFQIYATDIEQLKKSWKKLFYNGARKIWPGHGNPFPVEKIMPLL
jgi:glyoxylase-like metal-dependent hydrolase (beta-lactamase superfamily II)